MDDEITSAQVRAIGEHYVVARLLSLGLIVGLAPENTKNVDIIAMSGDGKKSIQIQVKTRTMGKSSDEGWHMQQKHELIINENLFYIFVAIPSKWTDKEQPETFIIPSEKVASVLKKSHIDWRDTPGKDGHKRADTKMRRLLPMYKDSPSISSDWLKAYRDNWKILGL